MRIRTYFLAYSLLLAASITSAVAQITIDTDDIKSMYAVGRRVIYNLDTTTTSLNIGATGASSWDFSGLKTTSTMPLVSVPVSSTPYAAQFPSATHVMKDTALELSVNVGGLGNVLLQGTGYDYLQLSGDLFDYGLIGDGKAYLGSVSGSGFPAHGQWLDSLAAVYYGLPLEYGNGWSTGFTQILSGYADLSPLGGIVQFGPYLTAHYIVYTVDAYGPLTLPGGYVEDALRVRKEDRTATSFTVGYFFLTKRGAEVQFNQTDTTSSSGIVGVRSVQWNEPLIPTSVPPAAALPVGYSLAQNYPNPFNPSTVISAQWSVTSVVRLSVYNLLGQEVAVLANGEYPAGQYSFTFNGNGLASGIYFYKLTAGNYAETRSMVLMK